MTFPRLAAAGFWTWFIGAVLVIISIVANGGPGGGNRKFVGLFLVGHIVVLLGLVAAAGSLATTVLTTRAPGMNMREYRCSPGRRSIGALGVLLVLPAVIGALIFTYVDYRYGRVGFGGNQAINDWIGFGFTQPATFVYAVPAFGFAAEVIAVASGRKLPMRGVDVHRYRSRRHQRRARRRDCSSPQICRATSAHFSLGSMAQRRRSVRDCSTCCRCSVGSSSSPSVRSPCAAAGRGSSRRWCSVCSAP